MTASELLHEAAAVIDQRGASRDLPAERSMRRAVEAFNALSGQTLTETQGWLFMAVLKLSRALGGGFNRDDLLDGAAYMALALECELANPLKTLTKTELLEAVGVSTPSVDNQAPLRARLLQEWAAASSD